MILIRCEFVSVVSVSRLQHVLKMIKDKYALCLEKKKIQPPKLTLIDENASKIVATDKTVIPSDLQPIRY